MAKGKLPPWMVENDGKGKGKGKAPAKGGKPNPFAKKASGGKKGAGKGKC